LANIQETIIDLPSVEHFSEAFKAINPQHAVPALNHNGAWMTQSLTVLRVRKYRALLCLTCV